MSPTSAAFDVLEHDEGRAIAGHHIGVQHSHHMGMLGDSNKLPVLSASAVPAWNAGRCTIELDCPCHITQGVDHLVDDAKGTGSPQPLCDHELVGQLEASRQIGVIRGGRCSGSGRFYRRRLLRLLLATRRQQLRNCLLRIRSCRALGRIERTEALQPVVEACGGLCERGRGLQRENPALVEYNSSGRR